MGNTKISDIVKWTWIVWAVVAISRSVPYFQGAIPIGNFLNSMVGITALTVFVVALLKFPKVACALIVAFSLLEIFK